MKTEKTQKEKTHSEKTFLVGSEPIHRMRLMIYFFLSSLMIYFLFFYIENIGLFSTSHSVFSYRLFSPPLPSYSPFACCLSVLSVTRHSLLWPLFVSFAPFLSTVASSSSLFFSVSSSLLCSCFFSFRFCFRRLRLFSFSFAVFIL